VLCLMGGTDDCSAVQVGVFNAALNSMNTGMALYTGGATPTGRYFGIFLFVLGSLVETGAEMGRKRFKSDPGNKGRLYMEGLFGSARHVNFGGYLAWRTGLAV